MFPWLPAKSSGGSSTWWGVEETSCTAARAGGHSSSGNVSSQSQRWDLNDPIMSVKTHYSCTLMKQLCSSLLLFPASFTLPEQGEHLDQVMFVELSSDEALKLLTHYKEEAHHLLPTPPKRKKHRQGSQNHPVHHCGKKRRFHFCCCIVEILILEHDIEFSSHEHVPFRFPRMERRSIRLTLYIPESTGNLVNVMLHD